LHAQGKEHVKIHHLNTFYSTGLVTEGWSMSGVGEGDERVLLEQYHRCVSVYKRLSTASQVVIADITRRMGEGMASYVGKDLGQGTVTVDDYNLYCHYVAGLVGEGLSRLFTCSGYESPAVAGVSSTLANTMGLFLQVSASTCVKTPVHTCTPADVPSHRPWQKTNIIRDYLEDYVDGRAFWPQQIWKKYTTTGDLGELAQVHGVRALLTLQKLTPVASSITCDDINCSRSRGPARWRA
jgi:farnesyl-diphosphate farnesyltransferase